MDHLLQYLSHHGVAAALAVATALAVLLYEAWLRLQNAAAVAPQEAIRLMNQGATVLDIRTSQAYAEGHINGARHLEAAQIPTAGDALKRFKERTLIVYCDRGALAPSAVRTLSRQGFTKVVNLRGGLAAWRSENLPLARG
ncbi:MAG TPA: rhodanese-like domain-containing protein [Steroidobacteraceae bacterium]|nr:rhodanese-like domain-containing protein [Steroidobacteraceae bacterium]